MQKRDLEFLYEMGTLRFIHRTWRQFLVPNCANLSEHTMRVCWIAMIIAGNEKNVDTGKVLKMALAHDIGESRTGDAHYLSRQYVVRHEEAAISDMLSGTSIEQEYVDLVKEYEKRECIEAKIVKDADNLDFDFELMEQKASGHVIWEKKQAMRKKVAETKLFTETAKKMWDEIQKSDPHDWHHNAPNRFVAGDWKTS